MHLEFKKIEDGITTFVFTGSINQDSEAILNKMLAEEITSDCIFDLENIESVDSYGVRAWIGFIQKVTGKFSIKFIKCNVNVVQQMNMISEFSGKADIESVIGEYECTDCGHHHLELFEKDKNLPEFPDSELPELKCIKCGSEMEMECLEEEFFHWLEAG